MTARELVINHSLLTYTETPAGPEEATTGRLVIHAGPLILTAIKPSRSGPIVSSLHLANWLAANWFRIRLETRPNHDPDLDWWQSHCMQEAANGYQWPNITLWASENGEMLVTSEATPDMTNTTYAGANDGKPIEITRESFERTATALIEETLAHLERANTTSSDLHNLYNDLKAEFADPELLAQREDEARRGEDPPYECDSPENTKKPNWVMDALKDFREHVHKAEEYHRDPARKSDLPGHNEPGPTGHSFWDGEEWYLIPGLKTMQVLRALLQDPSPENLEAAQWYTDNTRE